MAGLEVSVAGMESKTIYGIWKNSNDRTVAKDIPKLSEAFHKAAGSVEGKAFPYIVLSRNYNEKTKDFELFVGSTLKKETLEELVLPAGEYAKITVRPKLGFLWGLAVGEAKRYLYTRWIQESGYEACNMEYEFHTEKSIAKHPEIEIFFAIRRK